MVTYDIHTAYQAIVEHFSREGAEYAIRESRSSDPVSGSFNERMCVYRMDEDPSSPIRCAFGVLIPDDKYNPAMEGEAAIGILISDAYGLEDLAADQATRKFIATAQGSHDQHAALGDPMKFFLSDLKDIYERARNA